MAFLALRFDADAATADAWSDLLLDAGALSVDIADPDADTLHEKPIFDEPGAPLAVRWPMNRITGLFAAGTALEDVVNALAARAGHPVPPHSVLEVPDQDWVRATQAQFGPIAITCGLWIVPSWCAPVDTHATNLVLDPGLAFGTGSHPTTRLCLQWLARASLHGRTVLDYGCGSGILAIAAARLGAAAVVGTDVDPQALQASRQNAVRNAVHAEFVAPDALPRAARYDVVVANILANPLVVLAPALAQRVAAEGTIVLSGILAHQAEEVAECYARWFRINACTEDEGWTALVGTREPRPE